jgi:hypothetical protein
MRAGPASSRPPYGRRSSPPSYTRIVAKCHGLHGTPLAVTGSVQASRRRSCLASPGASTGRGRRRRQHDEFT